MKDKHSVLVTQTQLFTSTLSNKLTTTNKTPNISPLKPSWPTPNSNLSTPRRLPFMSVDAPYCPGEGEEETLTRMIIKGEWVQSQCQCLPPCVHALYNYRGDTSDDRTDGRGRIKVRKVWLCVLVYREGEGREEQCQKEGKVQVVFLFREMRKSRKRKRRIPWRERREKVQFKFWLERYESGGESGKGEHHEGK